jgi:hypothetical protein
MRAVATAWKRGVEGLNPFRPVHLTVRRWIRSTIQFAVSIFSRMVSVFDG